MAGSSLCAFDHLAEPENYRLTPTFRATCQRGEAHHEAKLTEEQVREIRRRAAAGETRRAIARSLGVSRWCITLIVNRRTWKHV